MRKQSKYDYFIKRTILGKVFVVIAGTISLLGFIVIIPFYILFVMLFTRGVWGGKWIKDWLEVRISEEEIEKMFSSADKASRLPEEWAKIKKQIQPGDELWKFSSPGDTWQRMCGRSGICLKRGDKIVSSIITMKN